MSDTQAQLDEINALLAATPNDPSLLALKDDLMQLITLEGADSGAATAEASSAVDNESAGAAENEEPSADYTAKGTFTSHTSSIQSSIAEAPDISAFQPVASKPAASAAAIQPASNETTAAAAAPNNTEPEKKKKKKKKSESSQPQTFELPNHLVPLESDTPAQKLKKARAAKSLKSKFRAKQKEVEATKKANDWKSFATKTKKKVGSSIFSTEEGVNARVGVVSGGGSRGMTDFGEGEKKRHKFA